jgi:hypothetical protein
VKRVGQREDLVADLLYPTFKMSMRGQWAGGCAQLRHFCHRARGGVATSSGSHGRSSWALLTRST